MSSLWTPGGEVPLDRNEPAPEPRGTPGEAPGDASGAAPDEEALRAELDRMQRQVLEAPAADVVAQHAVALYELAALHLSQEEPRLPDARLAIDAFAALVEGLAGRLGQAEQALAQALPQLRMAFVEASDRSGGRATD